MHRLLSPWLCTLVLAMAGLPAAASEPLDLNGRIACKAAIEQVYWKHRTWPASNPAPKPPLSETLPAAALRVEVERTVLISNALERFWQRPVRAAELRAELRRIFRDSRDRERLEEIVAALGGALDGNSYRLAECLARPLLVERLARAFYAEDERFGAVDAEDRPSFDEWLESVRPSLGLQLATEPAAWAGWEAPSAAEGSTPPDDRWRPTAALPESTQGISVVWTGSEMIVWGGGGRSTGSRYDPATDTWTTTAMIGAPAPRTRHTAVWTGTEMIVWGGCGQDGFDRNTGGRYDPALNSWMPTSTAGAPSPRSDHRAVWTGTEMIVWGRLDPQGPKTGGRYDPVSDTWVPTSVNDPRAPRANHVAVWTGSEMLIWGGDVLGGGSNGLGDRYDPATDSWMPMSDAGEPSNREHGLEAVWTGTEMIVWGGQTGTTVFDTGGRYNPSTNTWQPTSTVNAPVGRAYHAMVWAGTRVFVWGGDTETTVTATGGLYDPASDSWTPTTLAGAPSPRAYTSAVWTGSRAMVWGGRDGSSDLATGGAYDPATDSWTPTATAGAPSPRHFHTLLWTGSRMLVWGGMEGTLDNGVYFSSGGLYDPATGVWTPTSLAGAPDGRIWHADVWTGQEMIVWGGCNGPSPCATELFTGARYDPELGQWTATPLQSAPGARSRHTGVWTGTSLIVWGGHAGAYGSYTTTGGVYTPRADVIFKDGFESSDMAAWSEDP